LLTGVTDQTNLGCANSIIDAWFSADFELLRFVNALV
jgi:hypothetical protein